MTYAPNDPRRLMDVLNRPDELRQAVASIRNVLQTMNTADRIAVLAYLSLVAERDARNASYPQKLVEGIRGVGRQIAIKLISTRG